MPESRDRLPRPVDVTAMFGRRRLSVGTGILLDEPEEGPNLFGSPIRTVTVTAERTTTMATGSRGPMAVSASRRGERGSFGTPRFGNGRGRNLYGTQSVGRENTPAGTSRRGRGRSTGTVLPSWYPRTPLRDITAVVRAIERRRARLREIEGQPIESPIPQEQSVLDPSVATSGAQLEHDISMISPNPMIGTPCPPPVGKVSKILLGVTNQTAGESDFLTPQKKLLNSIDTVEKVVMEELRKLKRTPSAKKAEREKRVRTLMSMR